MLIEVHVQPVTPEPPCLPRGLPDEFGTDAAPLHLRMNGGVEQKCVNTAVLGDIDESDQLLLVVSCDVGEAACQNGFIAGFIFVRPRGPKERF